MLALLGAAAACGGPKVKKAVTPEHCTARSSDGEISLDAEQAQVATTIVAVAVKKRLPVRAVTIALATAEQESKMRNLDYGDRDSVGVFQQRPSQGWGTPEQLQDPVYATKRFYRALVKIDGYEQLPIEEAAQRVQRSAYGPAYAEHEAKATVVSTALTGRNGGNAFSCLLRPKHVPTDATKLDAAVEREWGPRAVTGKGTRLVVDVGPTAPTRHTLAMSFWMVARAKTFGLESVKQSDRLWRANHDEAWSAAKVANPKAEVSARLLPEPTPTPSD